MLGSRVGGRQMALAEKQGEQYGWGIGRHRTLQGKKEDTPVLHHVFISREQSFLFLAEASHLCLGLGVSSLCSFHILLPFP